MRPQYVDARARPLAQLSSVVPQLRDPRHNALAITRYPLAIHVAGKFPKAQSRQPLRPSLSMGVEARPSMHHQDAWTRVPSFRIPCELTCKFGIAIAIRDRLR